MPFLIKLLGAEAYGLIAFLFLLQSLLQILDLGMGPLLNREIARFTRADTPEIDRTTLATFVVTMERWYWLLGAAVGLLMFLIVPLVVTAWLKPVQLSADEMNQSAQLFAVLACMQWSAAFYQNGLLGMQRQVELNFFQIVFGSLNAIGGVIFVWLGPRSVSGLLTWHCVVTLVQLLVMARFFWSSAVFPRVRFRADFGTCEWRFNPA